MIKFLTLAAWSVLLLHVGLKVGYMLAEIDHQGPVPR